MADIPTGVLKEAPLGKRGFDKDLVLTYVDELNNKIKELEDELEERDQAGEQHESQLVQEYRRDLETAQKRLAEAEKVANDSAAQLQGANDKAAQLAAALKTEKEGRSADAQKMKQLLQQAQASSVDEGQVREYKEEIVALKGEISQMISENEKLKNNATVSVELSESIKALQDQLSVKDTEMEKLQSELNDLGGKILDKDSQISELKSKVEELESQSSTPSFIAPEMDMSAIYAEAQKNANQLVVQAKTAADKMTRDAETKAKKTVEDADAKAKQTTEDADAQAKKTIDDANAEAERIMKYAEERAAKANSEADAILEGAQARAEAESIRIKADAQEQEKKVRQLTATIRSMLTIEIEGMEKSIQQASSLMAQATAAVEEKISSANAIIKEARSSVEDTAKMEEQRMDEIMSAPAPEYKAVSEIGSGKASPSNKDDFAESMMNDFAAAPDLESNFKNLVRDVQATPMSKPGKKLNFDMSELVKDAEASISD